MGRSGMWAIAPKVRFDDERKLLHNQGMYEIYHRFPDIYERDITDTYEAATPTYLGTMEMISKPH